jgi:hypothetical protein
VDGRRQLAAENQRLDRMRREKEDRTAEELAAELNERYRRTARSAKSEYSEVPQRMLMPSVHDPGLYSVRCKVRQPGARTAAWLCSRIPVTGWSRARDCHYHDAQGRRAV